MARLSRDLIVDAALRLIDEGGIEGLTMRALGAECGVRAMSLYRYIANKDALLDAVQERIVAEMGTLDTDKPWREAVETMARGLREVLARHPRAIPLFVRPAATNDVLTALGQVLDVLLDAGFDEGDALRAFQALLAFVVGHAMWQFTPHGIRAVDDEFEFGLEVMLIGLGAKLED
jgi:AcrR family transcriptional regulator